MPDGADRFHPVTDPAQFDIHRVAPARRGKSHETLSAATRGRHASQERDQSGTCRPIKHRQDCGRRSRGRSDKPFCQHDKIISLNRVAQAAALRCSLPETVHLALQDLSHGTVSFIITRPAAATIFSFWAMLLAGVNNNVAARQTCQGFRSDQSTMSWLQSPVASSS